MASLLVYGSYGFVGRLVAEEAVERGVDVVLGGRDRDALAEQSADLGRPALGFAPDEPLAVRDAVEEVDCVLNCAGPFSTTAGPLVDACIQTGTDYVDITGEIPVVERIHGWDEVAGEREVTLLPSAAFSSVPMACLAAHLADRLPEATHLALGASSVRVPSVGTLRTVVEGADTGGAVRRDGRLRYVPAGWKTRTIDFGSGPRPAVTMPMGDVSTAYYATGIPNVEVYAMVPPPGRLALKAHRYLAPVLSTTPVQWTLKRLADLVREGPSERARRRGSVDVWGEARAGDERAVARLKTPDAYPLTVDAAVTTAQRVLAGDAPAGYQTPPGAFGPEFVLELDGVEGFLEEARPVPAGRIER